MKALIIENEYFLPGELEGFIKDNPQLFPNRMEDINLQISCLHRPIEDIVAHIPEAEAIIVMSTFMYKNQLELYVSAFASGKFGIKKFYCYRFEHHANEFLLEDNSWAFNDQDVLRENLKKLAVEHEIYDIVQDRESDERVTDEYWDGCSMMINLGSGVRERPLYKAVRLLYNEEFNVFHAESSDPEEESEYYAHLKK